MSIQTKELFLFYLPLRDNQGTPFPEDDFAMIASELSQRFGGLTRMRPTQEVAWLGEWLETATQTLYHDEIISYQILADAVSDTELFFVEFKTILKTRFRQEEIFMISFPVKVY
ncbi:hypothetical protein HYR99_06440 [Candidatus Poribacteria bacterium]|nr:hypothetical protein [Candidatus Poribacteria bacterium]